MKRTIYSIINRLDWGEYFTLVVSRSAMERNELTTKRIKIQMNAFGFGNYRELNKNVPSGQMLLPNDTHDRKYYLIKEEEIEDIILSFQQAKKMMKPPRGSASIWLWYQMLTLNSAIIYDLF